jgi:lipopolysaccharide heptosyltransferase II
MKAQKILIRLPNWLGDMVMAAGFMHQLQAVYPQAEVSVIVKKGIHDLLPFFPPLTHQFIFDKAAYKGSRGVWRFGKEIAKTESFDLFFCLPESFSSALMGRATGAKMRVGFTKEWRTFLFTHTYKKPDGLHRAEVYLSLLEQYSGVKAAKPNVQLQHRFSKESYMVVNINSEASSRRLTVTKATELIKMLQAAVSPKIVLIGAPKEQAFVHEVLKKLPTSHIENKAGKTNLPELVHLLASAQLVLTTDSGPAHLANALGTHTIVLFGAGNEKETAPYNQDKRTIIRLGQLSCEPCEKNVCVRYGTPQCLERLDSNMIVANAIAHLNHTTL